MELMPRRLFSIASFGSVVFAGFTMLLCITAFVVNPREHHFSLSNKFHVGVWRGLSGDTLGRLVIFNDAEYGPYHGSIISIVAGNRDLNSVFERTVVCGDSFGVYYRYFRTPGEETLWTLMVSLWYPLLLFFVLPTMWIFIRKRSRIKSRPQG